MYIYDKTFLNAGYIEIYADIRLHPNIATDGHLLLPILLKQDETPIGFFPSHPSPFTQSEFLCCELVVTHQNKVLSLFFFTLFQQKKSYSFNKSECKKSQLVRRKRIVWKCGIFIKKCLICGKMFWTIMWQLLIKKWWFITTCSESATYTSIPLYICTHTHIQKWNAADRKNIYTNVGIEYNVYKRLRCM